MEKAHSHGQCAFSTGRRWLFEPLNTSKLIWPVIDGYWHSPQPRLPSHREEEHAGSWEAHFWPLPTLLNICACIAGMVARCLFWPRDLHDDPRACQEDKAEYHFGRVKQHSRGTMTIRDAVSATQLEHLRLFKKLDGAEKPKATLTEPVSAERAKEISYESMRTACILGALAEPEKTPGEIHVRTVNWYKCSAGSLAQLVRADAYDHEDDAVDFAEGEKSSATATAGKDAFEVLHRLAERSVLTAKLREETESTHPAGPSEVEQMADNAEQAEAEIPDTSPEEKVIAKKAKELLETCAISQPSVSPKPTAIQVARKGMEENTWSSLTMIGVTMKFERDGGLPKRMEGGMTEESADRLKKILMDLRSLTLHIQLGEGLLAAGTKLHMPRYELQLFTKMLAAGNAEVGQNGLRQMRHTQWFGYQTDAVSYVQKQEYAPATDVVAPEVYRSMSAKNLQVLLAIFEQRIIVGLVANVYRGCREEGGSRRQRITRQVPFGMPSNICRRVELIPLDYQKDSTAQAPKFSALAWEKSVAMDPIGNIRYELSTVSIKVGSSRIDVVLTYASGKALSKCLELPQPPALISEVPRSSTANAPAVKRRRTKAPVAAKVVEHEGFHNCAFPDNTKGAENMFAYMEFMLSMYKQTTKKELVDAMSGEIIGLPPVKGKEVKALWSQTVRRTPAYFRGTITKSNGPFSEQVFKRFMAVAPIPGNDTTRFLEFLVQITKGSAKILPMPEDIAARGDDADSDAADTAH